MENEFFEDAFRIENEDFPSMLVHQRVGPLVAGCNFLEATSRRNPGPYCHFELSREITRWGFLGMGVHEMVIQDGWKGWFGKDWSELCCDFCYTNNHHFTTGGARPKIWWHDVIWMDMDSYISLQLLTIFIFPINVIKDTFWTYERLK